MYSLTDWSLQSSMLWSGLFSGEYNHVMQSCYMYVWPMVLNIYRQAEHWLLCKHWKMKLNVSISVLWLSSGESNHIMQSCYVWPSIYTDKQSIGFYVNIERWNSTFRSVCSDCLQENPIILCNHVMSGPWCSIYTDKQSIGFYVNIERWNSTFSISVLWLSSGESNHIMQSCYVWPMVLNIYRQAEHWLLCKHWKMKLNVSISMLWLSFRRIQSYYAIMLCPWCSIYTDKQSIGFYVNI